MVNIIKKIFGTAQQRRLKKYQKIVAQVNRIEAQYQSLTDDELKAKTAEFKARFKAGESLDALLPEAYAVVKNACRRVCGQEFHVFGYNQKWDMIPYDVQILGATAMHYGAIAEMHTGEGKTLTASMPLYLNALSGEPVHLVTVNDYLAQRDCEWIGSICRWLGLDVRPLLNSTPHYERPEVYKADIVYGTASEFGFDYLRDNSMASSASEQVQRGYFFAIVDEIDSILIDEARTPLIISGPVHGSRQMYDVLKDDVASLVQLQQEFCSKKASNAKDTLERLGSFAPRAPENKLSKKQIEEEGEAFRQLWLVSKGMPHNKVLRRIRENPDHRAAIEKWDTYYHGEANKDDRHQALKELYIIIDEKGSEYELTDKGIQAWSDLPTRQHGQDDFTMLDLGTLYVEIDQDGSLSEDEKIQRKVALREEDVIRKERAHNLRQLLRAHLLMEKDVDYIVKDDKIMIVDENTGRTMPGRRFSDGLHQAIEAKEGVDIQGETQTYASITLQNYFRMYKKLAGMTGTAITEAGEFKEIYGVEVLQIPTNRPCVRFVEDDEVYMTEREKYAAILKDVEQAHREGRPILIGTESVEVSEKLSRILQQHKLPHNVLNARQHEREAEIIANAGDPKSITVATNMAGRGTDIKLQGKAVKNGGLYVIGTTRHESRRIDLQLLGRSGRQGDPGSAKFYVSFEDPLMRLFTSPKITAVLQRFRPPEGEAIKAKMLNRSIETAQKRVEQRNYSIRKHTLEYDDVMNKQRSEIYSFRNEVLHCNSPIDLAREIFESLCLEKASQCFIDRTSENGWRGHEFHSWLVEHFPVALEKNAFDDDYTTIEEIEMLALKSVMEVFDLKMKHEYEVVNSVKEAMGREDLDPKQVIDGVIRSVMIRSVDKLWQEQLLRIDHLRSDVHLRSFGQKDPLLEFKHEAFQLFNNLSFQIKLEISHALFRFEMRPPAPRDLPDISPQNFLDDEIEDAEVVQEESSLPPLEEELSLPSRRVSLFDLDEPLPPELAT